jgi:hypothetical protein
MKSLKVFEQILVAAIDPILFVVGISDRRPLFDVIPLEVAELVRVQHSARIDLHISYKVALRCANNEAALSVRGVTRALSLFDLKVVARLEDGICASFAIGDEHLGERCR